VKFAKAHPKCLDGQLMRCSCNQKKCRNWKFLDEDTVKSHIAKYGFVENYETWIHHGESDDVDVLNENAAVGEAFGQDVDLDNMTPLETMIRDAAGPSLQSDDCEEHA